MDRFILEKLVVSGGGHQDSVIAFGPGLNVIIGPSNSGKTLIMDCIDYVFGFTPKVDHPSKIVDNSNGYKEITLYIKTAAGTVILKREIGDAKISVSGSDTTIEHGTYSTGRNAKKLINTIFLQMLGIEESHKVLSSQKGGTQSLTWRSMLHLFFMRQADIARETSALLAPGGYSNTASPAVLLYLLTGQDADNLEKPELPEISVAKKKALMIYIRDKADRLTKQREELEAHLIDAGFVDAHEAVDELHGQIDAIQKELDDAGEKSQALMSEIYEQNGKLSECNTVIQNFSILRQQYQSDISRLGFIVDGNIGLSSVPPKKKCPFCDGVIVSKPTPQYIEASSAELDKIEEHLTELEKARVSVDKQRQIIIATIAELEQKKKQIDSLITDQLLPQLQHFRKQLEDNLLLMRLSGELDVVRQNENLYRSELFEKETEETPENPKYDIISRFDYDTIHGFEEILIDILSKSKVGGAMTARLNMTNFDIEIAGLKKAVSMGGGFCSILNTITAMAMSLYLIECGAKAPGFFSADSSLTQLSEAEHKEQEDTIKQNFVQYLVDHAHDRQVIIIEQKKRMPFIPQEDDEGYIKVIEFSQNRNVGRYGFLNDVYNPGD